MLMRELRMKESEKIVKKKLYEIKNEKIKN